ncbi:hypothetical protein TrST_g1056 [Triparma strigata]|uniref:Uncharacterized protein n=1 Tax=Triparma strigata TaxID=1606541 RepID=A0A9W6ZY02_9STRA|nr:hypothetical protein TrST_g1056 [Triparma strigata]
MSLSDDIPENGSFSVALTTCSLVYKQSVFPIPEQAEGDAEAQPPEAPECYAKLTMNNASLAFPVEESPPAGEGEEEKQIDPAVTLTSEVVKGELVEGTTYSYSFTLSAESKAKLAIASDLVSKALINDGGSVEVWMKGAEGAEDEKLGGDSFKMSFDGAEIELALGVVVEVEKKEEEEEGGAGDEEKKAEDGGEGGEEVTEEKVDEDTSPGSLSVFGSTSKIALKVSISDSISDYVDGGASLTFGDVVVEDVAADVFGVTLAVDDEVSNDDYLFQLGEKLEAKNAASKFAVEISGENLPTMTIEGGSVSFETVEVAVETEVEKVEGEEEEEAKADGEGEGEGGEGDAEVKEGEEEAPPAPIVRPTVQYKLTFESGSSPFFMSYEEGKVLKGSIRGGSEYKVTLRKTAGVVESSEPVVEDKKGKKGKKDKKEAEVEAEPDADAGSEDYEESCTVSLGGLIEAKSSQAVVRGSLDESMSGVTGVISLDGEPLFKGLDSTGEAGGSDAIAELAGLPYVRYAKSLDRDMFAELRDKMDSSVDRLVEEYASLFLLNESAYADLSKQDKLKRMLYHMNKKGGYFELKEALKPCLQRVVAEKLEGSDLFVGNGVPRLDTDEGNRYVTSLFHFLLTELNQSLIRKFVPQCVLECREGIENDISVAKNVPNKMVKLKMLAEDAEGNKDYEKSRKWHLDRISMAEVETRNEKFGFRYLIKSKVDFADFQLSSGGGRSEAVSALIDAVGLDYKDVDNAMLLSALLLDEGIGEPAKYLNGVFEMLLGEDESGDGFDESSYAGVSNASTLSILLAIKHKAAGENKEMRKALRIAGKAAKLGGSEFAKRHVIVACLDAAEYLLGNKLEKAAKVCLDWADEFEEKAKATARDFGASTSGVKQLRAKQSLCSAKFLLQTGDFEGGLRAVVDAEKRYKNAEAAEKGVVALVYAQIADAMGDEKVALAKYLAALKLLEDPVPFPVYVALYGLLSRAERWAEAREVMFRAAKSWSYASVWLNISKASIKLEYYEDAEDSLQESNGADTNDPRSWGLFVIVCLKKGERLQEANEGLKQALGLGLGDLDILREMGDLFVEIDEMVQAEAVWRRAVEVEQGGVEFGLRLSKCLEAQREFEAALENYDSVVSGNGGGKGVHLVEQERAKLVKKMGKDI